MFKSYIISVLRSLWKSKLNTFVIIFSIGIAIASSMLLFKYSNYQLSFDKFYENSERIYRIPFKKTVDGQVEVDVATNVTALAPWLKENFPEIEDATRIIMSKNPLVFKYTGISGENSMIEKKISWVDTNFCNLFPIEFIYGSCETAFKHWKTVSISKSLSESMFGNENPLGKKLYLSPGNDIYEIVGVYKDFPPNTHLSFEFLMSYKHISGWQMENSWSIIKGHTYLLLKEKASRNDLQEKINHLLKGELARLLIESIISYYPEAKDYDELCTLHNIQYEFPLEPLSQLNFSLKEYDIRTHKEKRMTLFLLAISILILLIAWINYFNLAIVKVLENVANTQIRKVVGANKNQIFTLLIIESIVINLLGIFFALIIYRIAYQYFINLSDLPREIYPYSLLYNGISNSFTFILMMLILFMISMLVPLIMPIIKIFIKDRHFGEGHTVPFRNIRTGSQSAMVIIQFIVSVFMIASTVTIYKQMNFMNKKELGFNPEQILVVKSPTIKSRDFYKNYKPFYEEIKKNTIITDYSESNCVPPLNLPGLNVKRNHNSQKYLFSYIVHNKDYFNFFNIDIIAGANFINGSEFLDSVNRKVIINETASNLLGFDSPKEAIGQSMLLLKATFQDFFSYKFPGGKAEIIGVCNDYYHNSVRKEKKPMIFFQIPEMDGLHYFCLKFRAESASDVLVFFSKKWKEYFPDYPLNSYYFLDEKFQKEYDSDKRFGILSGIFSFLAVVLACTGLFMLSSFNILKRIKEVGIRKSNGASSLQIIILFVKKFLYLILIAYIISAPLSYFIMNKWLQNYPYRITLGLWFFLIPLALITIITMGTILYQVYIAARTNPVETLRYE